MPSCQRPSGCGAPPEQSHVRRRDRSQRGVAFTPFSGDAVSDVVERLPQLLKRSTDSTFEIDGDDGGYDERQVA